MVWDMQDKDFLKENAHKFSINELTELFNNKYTKTQIKNCCDFNGYSYRKLTAKERGYISSCTPKSPYRVTAINRDYFKTWTENMAYIFGLWCADGNILHTSGGYFFSLKLKKTDRYLLQKILDEMDSKHKIYEKDDNSCEISLSCKTIYEDIMALGGCEKKSLVLRFPKVPDEYLNHFIRGYFDGDGCLYQDKKRCSLICTHQFGCCLIDVLNRNQISISGFKQKHPERGSENNCFEIYITRKAECNKFMQFLYNGTNDSSLIMERKNPFT